jgi:hypothetical protein
MIQPRREEGAKRVNSFSRLYANAFLRVITPAISARIPTNADTTWLFAMTYPRSQTNRVDYYRQDDMMSARRLVCVRHDIAIEQPADSLVTGFHLKKPKRGYEEILLLATISTGTPPKETLRGTSILLHSFFHVFPNFCFGGRWFWRNA